MEGGVALMAEFVESIRYEADITDLREKLRRIDSDHDGVARNTDTSTGKMDKAWRKVTSGLGGVLASLAKVGVAVGAAAAVAGVALVPKVLESGAALDAMGKKAATVFEGSLGDVQAWAKEVSGAFGLTGTQATGLAANMADLLKPMGFTAEQAAGMSQDMVGLSGALSAWSAGTRSTAEVSEILQAALLGERDALKGLGISITEADVQTRLAAKGQGELTGVALEQAKALATQELIFEKSTDAQKAWADGSMDAVKKNNELRATFEKIKETLIKALYPALATGVAWMADKFIPKAQELAEEWMPKIRAAFQSVADWVQSNWPTISAVAQDVFAKVQEAIDWVRLNVIPGIVVAFNEIVAFVQENWPQIKATATDVFTTLQTIIQGAVDFITTIWNNFGEQIVTFIQGKFEAMAQVVEGLLQIIRGVVQTVTALIHGDWSKAWEGIKAIFEGVWNVIVGVGKDFLNTLQAIISVFGEIAASIWSSIWANVQQLFSSAWQGIKNAVSTGIEEVTQFFRDLPGNITSALGDLLGLLVSKGTDLVQGLFNGIKNLWVTVAQWWAGLPIMVVGAIGNVAETLLQKGKNLISGLWDGAKDIWLSVTDWLASRPASILNWIGDLSDVLLEVGKDVMRGLWNGMKSIWGEITGWLSNLNPANWFNDINPYKGHAIQNLVSTGEQVIHGLQNGMEAAWNDTATWLKGLNPSVHMAAPQVLPGHTGDEVMTVLAGETGRTARQERMLQQALRARGDGARTGVAFTGPVTFESGADVDAVMRIANFHLAGAG